MSIIEPYDANSHYTFVGGLNVPAYPCELGVDVSDGETIAATVTDFGAGPDTGCATAVPAYGPVGDWTWQLRPNQMPPEAFLFGVYTATRSSCVGTVQVRLSSDNMPFAASVEGEAPHLIMERDFAADANNPDCPSVPTAMVDAAGNLSCSGYFVVNASLAAPVRHPGDRRRSVRPPPRPPARNDDRLGWGLCQNAATPEMWLVHEPERCWT